MGADELHAVLLALGCRLTLQEVGDIIQRGERHVRADADKAPKQPKPQLALFHRDFHVRPHTQPASSCVWSPRRSPERASESIAIINPARTLL